MNSERSVLKRLLKLYPVKNIKDEFDTTHSGEALYQEVVESKNANLIRNFAYTNIDNTKQHVYIYYLDKIFNPDTFNPFGFPYPIINQTEIVDGIQIIISPTVEFRVILTNPFEETIMNFNQPYIITLKNRHLTFQATILEKNMATYFEDGRKVINVEKINDETVAIRHIIDFLNHYHPISCDINKGVKHIWHSDTIDSRYVKWKKNRSTTTESMDENYTLKSQYPDVYSELIKNPLNKTIFKYLPEDELLPDHFTVDPTKGEISVPLYSKNVNQIANAINEILSNN
jgi:hypothetical protein